MSSKNFKRQKMRELYAKGMDVEGIAMLFAVSTGAVYYHKGEDKRSGIDWDALRIERRVGDRGFREAHQDFLSSLFGAFREDLRLAEEERAQAKEGDPEASAPSRLDMLTRYANAYARLVAAARKAEPDVQVADVISRTLNLLVDIATEEGRTDLAAWLSSSIDDISARLKQEFRR